jgi:hypothetical protein
VTVVSTRTFFYIQCPSDKHSIYVNENDIVRRECITQRFQTHELGSYSIVLSVRTLKCRDESGVVGGGHVVLLLHNCLGEREIPQTCQLQSLDAYPQFRAI